MYHNYDYHPYITLPPHAVYFHIISRGRLQVILPNSQINP
jgi:hypothetical protein